MYAYGIRNHKTNERSTLFGRNINAAFAKAKLNPEEWEVEYADYID